MPAHEEWAERRKVMEHKEAIETMASERYLLGELTPAARDAFEDHLFGCTECAQDVRLGAAFIDRAKDILPGMVSSASSPAPASSPARVVPARETPERKQKEPRDWFAWMRPAFAVPVFALLLATVGYQNLVTYPSLVAASETPRILPPSTVLHPATRGAAQTAAVGTQGTRLTVDIPQGALYTSYTLKLYDAATKLVWSNSIASTSESDGELSLYLPAGFKPGTYRLEVNGAGSSGQQTGQETPIDQYPFDLRTNE